MSKKTKKTNQVIIGGTFDILHKGHKAFLKKAFSLGRVTIGLTSDEMAKSIKKRKVRSFQARKKELENFIRSKGEYKIIKIEDKFGPALKRDFDYLIVSPETYPTALLINKERRQSGKKPIKVVKIKFVLTENGKPISSGRILKGVR